MRRRPAILAAIRVAVAGKVMSFRIPMSCRPQQLRGLRQKIFHFGHWNAGKARDAAGTHLAFQGFA